MRYGVCMGVKNPEYVKVCEDAGCDYIESNFGQIARCTEEEFSAFEKAINESAIKCEAANCFMPGDLSMVGENVNYDAIREYVDFGMSRGAKIGLKTVVFGSGGARRLPEGWSYREGIRQLAYFLGEIVSPIAAKYGITVVTEPLRAAETNVINTVKEGVMLASFAGKDNISGLADLYHMLNAGDTNDDVRQLKGNLHHAHISNPYGNEKDRRIFPADPSEFDYKSFVDALEYAGCERCSVEAATSDFVKDTPVAISVLKNL